MHKSLLVLLLLPRVCDTLAQDSLLFAPVQDAVIGYHAQLNAANTNYNSADWFGALSQPGNLGGENNSRSLMLFDLSSLPPATVVDEALLDLYGRGPVGLGAAASAGNTGANACWLEHVIEPWEDHTVTWNTQPSTTPLNAVLLPESSQPVEDYIGVDVTDMVQEMINSPGTAHGFALRTQVEAPTRGLFFCGADHSDPSKRPRLRIKFNSIVGLTETPPFSVPLVYPNPVLPGTPFRLRLNDDEEVDTMVILDGAGRAVHTTSIERTNSEVQVFATLAPGSYHVVFQDRQGAVTGSSTVVVLLD